MADIPVGSFIAPTIRPTESPVESLDSVINAIRAGYQTAQQVPSTASAIAQGISGAIDAYREGVQFDEQSTLRQQQIQENALALETAEATQPQAIETRQAQLESEETKAQEIQRQILKKQNFENIILSGDPAAITQAVTSGQYADVLSDKNYAYQIYNSAPVKQALPDAAKNFLAGNELAEREAMLRMQQRVQEEAQAADIERSYRQSRIPGDAAMFGGDTGPQEILTQGQVIPDADLVTVTKGVGRLRTPDERAVSIGKEPTTSSIWNPQTGKIYSTGLTPDEIKIYNNKRYNTDVLVPKGPAEQAFGADIKRDAPQATPTPRVSPTPGIAIPAPQATVASQSAVQQGLQNYKNIQNSLPPFVSKEALDTRLQYKKQRNQAAVQAGQRTKADALSLPVPTPSAPPTQITVSPPIPSYAPTPAAGLSKVVPQGAELVTRSAVEVEAPEATLTAPVVRGISEETYSTVNSHPLLRSESALVKGLAAVESGGKAAAVSPTGVRGLLQVTRATAKQYGFNRDIPEENVKAGKLYLADLLTRFNDPYLALAAYNAGPGTIARAMAEADSSKWEDILPVLKDYLSPGKYKETSTYPDKVLAAASQFVDPDKQSDQIFVSMLDQNNLLRYGK